MTGKRVKKHKVTSGPKTSASKLDQAVAKYVTQLSEGTVLSIDPSSGSEKSQPGYALFKQGKLVDSGLVRLKYGIELSNRLYHLSKSLREDFEKPDILVTEHLAPFMGEGKGAFFSTRNVISLHQSVGVIMSVWDVPVLTVSPRSWHAITPDNYIKSDENDAIMIGWTALTKAHLIYAKDFLQFDDRVLNKLTTGKWEGK